MGSYYIKSQNGPALSFARERMANTAYFALAMAEYYSKKAKSFTEVITPDNNLSGYVSYANSSGLMRVIDLDDVRSKLFDEGNITAFTKSDLSQSLSVPAEKILGELVDHVTECEGFSSVFEYLSSLKPNDTVDSTKVLDTIRLRIHSDSFGAQIHSLLSSLHGTTPDVALYEVLEQSPKIDSMTEFNYEDYLGNGVNIVGAALLQIGEDILSGVEEILSSIQKIKDIGRALVKAGGVLLTNLMNILFPDILTDYEVYEDGKIGGFDIPIMSFYWDDLTEFESWLRSGYSALSGTLDGTYDKWSSCMPEEFYTHKWQEEQVKTLNGVLPYGFVNWNPTADEDLVTLFLSKLTSTGYFETLVNGIRIRFTVNKDNAGNYTTVHCYQYITGTYLSGSCVLNAYESNEYGADVSSAALIDGLSGLGSQGSISNQDILENIVQNNACVMPYFTSPIIPAGYSWNGFSDPSDQSLNLWSRFFGNPDSGSVYDVVTSLVVKDYPLSDVYLEYASMTRDDVLASASNIGQNFILFSIAYAFFSYRGFMPLTFTINTNWGDTITFTSNSDIPEGSAIDFYPYYTYHTCNPRIHAQTNDERIAEVKEVICKIAVAAAAVAVTVGVFKVRKSIRTKLEVAQSAYAQAQFAYVPGDAESVRNLMTTAKKARRISAVSKLLGVSPASAIINSGSTDDYSALIQQILKSITG